MRYDIERDIGDDRFDRLGRQCLALARMLEHAFDVFDEELDSTPPLGEHYSRRFDPDLAHIASIRSDLEKLFPDRQTAPDRRPVKALAAAVATIPADYEFEGEDY